MAAVSPVNLTLNIEHVLTDQHASENGKLNDEDILTLQIRAFLEASEDVDIDPETAEDLLQTLPDLSQENEAGANPDIESEDEDDHDAREMADIDAEELDISPLYRIEQEAAESWTEQEVKQMLHHLKERGMSSFVKEYVLTRNIAIPKLLRAFGVHLCPQLQNKRASTMLYFLRVAMSHQLRMRDKLPQYNTIDDAVNLIRNSQRILILTGAGISVSCGIPDFRSRDGLYASLKDRGEYDLDDPQQMFDINYFRENPSGVQIYPSNFVPSPCHRFIRLIEDKGKNYTQNIDTLETLAGVERVLQCHGSFATASCLQCRRKVPGKEIEAEIMGRKVPLCTVCNENGAVVSVPAKKGQKKKKVSKKKAKGQWDSDVEDESDGPVYPPGIMKPDITFFGEKLTDEFDNSLAADRDKVDLLLVVGTSLKVSPILINKTPIRHINPDIVLLGNADEIVERLCDELGWELPPPIILPTPPAVVSSSTSSRLQPPRGNLKKRPSTDSRDRNPPRRVDDSHIWLFDGAEGGKWLLDFQKELASQSATPKNVDSGPSTRYSTPGGELTVDVTTHREPKKPRIQ
ncbi:DHS-like NAD/FAD-binding domain-containing protein [Crucibulum laeve]|uniref:DHS-like NAD/FAD-binding domain-containing protein n=1 Tax=Crucibulum laeve TaxID=68775 RepID=A0A5C3M4Z3_9AGAR|nr:DHS-like NAD/FAD-binding domain-containing protein [Crucibulum laeve]